VTVRAPADIIEIFLQPGEFYFGEQKTRIRTLLGSCVAVTLWHPRLRIGGMCHYMLPRRPRRVVGMAEAPDGRYAEDAMKMFLGEITRCRTRAAEYQVKLFGGGSMFARNAGFDHRASIAETNVDFGRAAIAQCGFRLSAEDLGGDGHRNIILDLWSGDVWVRRTKLSASRSTSAA